MGVSKSIRRQLAAGEQPSPELVLPMTNYSIDINEASLFSIEEIVQADINERHLVRQESTETADEQHLVRQERAETAEGEADRRRQRNRVLGRSRLASGGRFGR
jgi:hypothetical protein